MPISDRKKNTISKQEFFNDPSVRKSYRSTKNGVRMLKDRGAPLEGADRLEWDHTHNDVEAYKGEKHLGSIDPLTKRLYKPAVPHRVVKN